MSAGPVAADGGVPAGAAAAPPPIPFDRLRAVVLDMDGTLWLGREPLPGLSAWFQFMAARDLPFVLATNNSYWPPEHYVDKLAAFGVAVTRAQILTSSMATGDWLARQHPSLARVYVVGGEALRDAVRQAGCALVEGQQPVADAVVAGIDLELTYAHIRDAARHIHRGARFIGTNPDRSYPDVDGLSPGAGSILAAIEAATGQPPTIIGKPAPHMFAVACAVTGVPPEQTLVVGDQLDTDIPGAHRAGMWSALVTSGVASAEEARTGAIRPHGVFGGLDALREAWAAAGATASG